MAEKEDVNAIDADSIIDAFLEENPDLAGTPVEEWPEEALSLLQDAMNGDGVDEPNGALPAEENEEGEPITEEPVTSAGDAPSAKKKEAPVPDVPEPKGDTPEPPPDQEEKDFDFFELSKMVEAGDKDGAWSMLQNMFGITPPEQAGPTNVLDRRMESSKEQGNALAKIIASLRN